MDIETQNIGTFIDKDDENDELVIGDISSDYDDELPF